jgi:hypothetical protein
MFLDTMGVACAIDVDGKAPKNKPKHPACFNIGFLSCGFK